MAQGKRADEDEPKGKGYEIGDLEVVRSGRVSGERPAVQLPPQAPGPPPPPRAHAPSKGTPRNLTLADGDLGPALELDLGSSVSLPRASLAQPPTAPRTSTSATALPPVHVSQPAAAVMASFGDGSALDDFDQGGFARLPSLDVEAVERRSAERVVAREPTPESPSSALAKEREEREAIEGLADFGPTPRSWLSSVSYAARVAQRVWKLRRARGLAQEALRVCLTEHHAAMVAMGRALLLKAAEPRIEPLRAKITRVNEEQAKVDHADQGVSRTREGNDRAMALLRSEAEHLKEQLAPYLAAEQQAAQTQRKADEEVRRAQAMQKRVEIELRALETATAADPARVDALSAQLEQRREVVTTLGANLAQATEALGKTRRDLALSRGALDANEEKQKRLEAESRARENEAEGHKQVAHGAYEVALSELAEAAKKQQLGALAAEPEAHTKNTEREVEQAGAAVVRFDRALALYDRQAVIRGAILFGAVVAGAIATILLH